MVTGPECGSFLQNLTSRNSKISWFLKFTTKYQQKTQTHEEVLLVQSLLKILSILPNLMYLLTLKMNQPVGNHLPGYQVKQSFHTRTVFSGLYGVLLSSNGKYTGVSENMGKFTGNFFWRLYKHWKKHKLPSHFYHIQADTSYFALKMALKK